MSYQVIARKWRPQLFQDLVGQEHVATTLKNAIINQRIAHSYIFTGPRGVGKTSAARIFAKALNCINLHDGEPCNLCSSCIEIADGNNLDVMEIDGASNNSVDNIRDLRDNIRFTPNSGRFRIYIIDEVHMLSKGAFNALLKTLEEPPAHALFIFATTEIHKVLPTILSRCQRFDFKRISVTKIAERLGFIAMQEAIDIGDDALTVLAKKADGGMRDAQSLLDQMISFCGTKISTDDINASFGLIDSDVFFKLTQNIINKDSASMLIFVQDLFLNGYELSELIYGFEEHIRNLLTCVSLKSAELLDVLENDKLKYLEHAAQFKEMDLLRITELLHSIEYSMKHGHHARIKLEIALCKMCKMPSSIELHDLVENIKKKTTEYVLNEPEIQQTTHYSQTQTVKQAQGSIPNPIIKPIYESVKISSYDEFSLERVRMKWQSFIDSIKPTKPNLYLALYQSYMKQVEQDSIYLVFQNDEKGATLQTFFKNSETFVRDEFSKFISKKFHFILEKDDLKSKGLLQELFDTEGIVKQIREKDSKFDEFVKIFGLEPISIGKNHGHQ